MLVEALKQASTITYGLHSMKSSADETSGAFFLISSILVFMWGISQKTPRKLNYIYTLP